MDRRLGRAFAALTLGLAALPAPAQLRFDVGRTFDVSMQPGDAHVVDVDADGHLDLVATGACDGSTCSNAFTVLRGDGTGAWVPRAAFTLPSQIFFSTVADLNGDSRVDLVFSTTDENDLFMYAGSPGGDFNGPFLVPVFEPAWSVVPADFDGDGLTDLAVSGAEDFRVFRQDASGRFSVASTRFLGAALAITAAADFDGDGRLDIAGTRLNCSTFCDSSGIQVLFGDGAGGWAASVFLAAPGSLSGLVAGDFDEDGDVDLAVSDANASSAASVRLFFGDGGRGFGGPVTVGAGYEAASLRAVDADADGHLDLAALTAAGLARSRTRLSFLRGAGDGTFGAPRHAPSAGALAIPADIDEDGRLDFLVRHVGKFIEHFGDGTGGFTGLGIVETGAGPLSVFAGDFVENGIADLLIKTEASDSDVWLHAADGRGGFASGRRVASDAFALSPPADFDEDGHLDFVSGSIAIAVRFGNGLGEFPRSTPIPGGAPYGSMLLTDDFDGDDHADVLAVHISAETLFHPGGGDGTFGASLRDTLSSADCRADEVDVAAADFDVDGRLDLAATLRVRPPFGTTSCLIVARGLGDGRFAAPSAEITLAPEAAKLATGDFDEDGRVDVAIAAGSSGVVAYLGNGDATLRAGASRPLEAAPTALAAADFDGDGHVDLAATLATADIVAVLRGDGRGGFAEPAPFGTGNDPRGVLAADLDADDDIDLATSNDNDDSISILRNETPIPFLDCRRGNVNVASGPVADVLFVNDSAGAGRARRVVVDRAEPFQLRLAAPPSNAAGPAPTAVWFWLSAPTPSSTTTLPHGLGLVALPTPFTPSRSPQPRLIANSIGFPGRLGAERWPSSPTRPAPTMLLDLPNGARRRGTYYAQGILADASGPNGVSAVTNGIELVVR